MGHDHTDHDHAEETPEEKAAREARQRAAATQNEGGIGSIIMGFFEIFANLIKAIFGAFTDRKDEHYDGDPAQTGGGRARAETFIQSLGDSRLRELATRYAGQKLENISPFKVPATISSNIGHRPMGNHGGLDMVPVVVNGQTIIQNTMPGVVVYSGTEIDPKTGAMKGYGHWIEVAGIDGIRRRYAHLAEKGVAAGTVLHQGDQIGIMGNTGHSHGAHLHYEWRDADGNVLEPIINGRKYGMDDRTYIGSRVTPADQTKLAELARLAGVARLPDANGGASMLAFNGQAKTGVGATHNKG